MTLLLSLVVLISCVGCARLVLHPIEKTDIFSIEKGSVVISPSGKNQTVEKMGWFLSDYYVKNVAEAKVE